MRRLMFLGVLAVSVLFANAAEAARRVALVIGNDQYQNLPKLQKAVADAGAYADVLKAKGFDEVMLKTDLSRGQMDEAVAAFIDQVEPGDTAVFAYSGHGWSDGSQNYIVGTDAPVTGSQELLARISIPLKNGLNGIIDALDQKGAALKVAIIDACRDNPFTPLPGKKGVGLSRGMVRIDPPHGTFVVFSAGEGQSALDRLSNEEDKDPNSVFTRVFVRAIRADLTLQDAIKTTQQKVVALAGTINEKQEPAYYDQVIGSACLSARCNGVAFGAAAASPDEVAWQRIATSTDPVDFESFERFFPDSPHMAEAEAKAQSQRTKESQVAALDPAPAPKPEPAHTSACEGGLVASIGNAGVAAAAERCLKPKNAFSDCGNCPEMVVIPAGSFTMGSPGGEKGRFTNEGPQHEVRIEALFAVGKFAVTFDQWDNCVGDGGCGGYRPEDNGWGRGQRPVINVSWDDAKAYVAWLSRKTGKSYRLLTEAEREYVTRAGTTTPYWWGTSISKDRANYNFGFGKTVPVDRFKANPFGLYNVHGNVLEWLEDCWHDSYAGAPKDGSAWTSGSCEFGALRGGAWSGGPEYLRAANRYGDLPGSHDVNGGFRVARTL